jgi:glutamate-ammonia-ligase adenylyltransferase
VLALGKLGSEELNYSSDVDLIYLYGGDGERDADLRDGPNGLSPNEYFTRLAQGFGRLVTETTGDGFLYRIDLDLRPEGSQGPLVVNGDMLMNYYELWAATWEKAAFMKARPVAGDIEMGWHTIRALDPIIFRSTTDYAGVAAIKEMKTKVERAKALDSAGDIKSGPGGIRDVELVAQTLQLLHGGRIPQVRVRSTQGALEALAQVELLPPQDVRQLLIAYRFLRRVENCLQMEAERQIHVLPTNAAALERLARALGFLSAGAAADFEAALERYRRQVRAVVSALFPEQASEPILELFARNAPRLFRTAANARMIERLAADFAREIDASTDPRRALTNLERFIQGVGVRPFYYELLVDRPELVPRLVTLFATSEYLSDYFAKYPRLIEPIFSDPTVLLLTRQQLEAEYRSVTAQVERDGQHDAVERGLAALRLFHHRALVNVGLLDLVGAVTRVEVERALTDIAEVCVHEAMRFARLELRRRTPELPSLAQGEFLVVGMGKLGSHELTYGSDLDVIFLYDVDGGSDTAQLEAQEHYVRLAQKMISALQTRTPEGLCYEIDARLRPSGNQGMLVTSLTSLAEYHAGAAQVWERQALLRARAVAGGERLARAFAALRLEILAQPLAPGAGAEVHRVRVRMERELANETKGHHDFKAGRGGLLDVESIVQFLQLQHGHAHPELLAVDATAGHLARLAALGLLSRADADTLENGWDFLQRLSSRLRIVENRSISDLDEERGDLDALARRLGYVATQRETGARRALLEDYWRHTTAIRGVYLRIMGVDS